MIGIYRFVNKITGESYIGQSVNIDKRYLQHKNRYWPGQIKFENSYFHQMLWHYGFHNFDFEILEECRKDELNDKEKFYIKKYNSIYPNGYNRSPGGNENPFRNLNQQKLNGIINDLREDKLSQNEIADKYNVHFNTISQINLGKAWYDDNIVYPIRDNSLRKKYYCKKCGKEIEKHKHLLCENCYHNSLRERIPKKEELYNELKNNSFEYVGRKYNVSSNAIRRWCTILNIPRYSSYYKSLSA